MVAREGQRRGCRRSQVAAHRREAAHRMRVADRMGVADWGPGWDCHSLAVGDRDLEHHMAAEGVRRSPAGEE